MGTPAPRVLPGTVDLVLLLLPQKASGLDAIMSYPIRKCSTGLWFQFLTLTANEMSIEFGIRFEFGFYFATN